MSSQPHDVLFHWLIAHPDEARSLLEGLLPSDIAEVADWSQLEVEVSRIDSPELVTRVPDAVCRAPLFDGGSIEVAIVTEHQSSPDDKMPFRMIASMGMLWAAEERLGHPMSFCIGLVIHHGARPWTSPRSVREHFAIPSKLDAVLGPYIPSHLYLVIDLAMMDAATLASLRISSPLVRATLFALQRAREAHAIDEELVFIEDDLRAIATRSDAEQALTAFFSYLVAVAPDRIDPIAARLTRTLSKDHEARIMGTILDEYVAKGIAIGEARGKAIGRAGVVIDQLEAKFGPLSQDLLDVITNGSQDEVDVWVRRILFAATLDEVFAARS